MGFIIRVVIFRLYVLNIIVIVVFLNPIIVICHILFCEEKIFGFNQENIQFFFELHYKLDDIQTIHPYLIIKSIGETIAIPGIQFFQQSFHHLCSFGLGSFFCWYYYTQFR